MTIGYLEIEVYLPGARSLKEKRMILNRVKDKLRSKYNVGVAEVDHNDKWQRAVLGIVGVSKEMQKVNSLMDKILDWFEELRELDIINYNCRFYQ